MFVGFEAIPFFFAVRAQAGRPAKRHMAHSAALRVYGVAHTHTTSVYRHRPSASYRPPRRHTRLRPRRRARSDSVQVIVATETRLDDQAGLQIDLQRIRTAIGVFKFCCLLGGASEHICDHHGAV